MSESADPVPPPYTISSSLSTQSSISSSTISSLSSSSSYQAPTRYQILKEDWGGSRSHFQHSHGLKMSTPSDFEEGNKILDGYIQNDEYRYEEYGHSDDDASSGSDYHSGYHSGSDGHDNHHDYASGNSISTSCDSHSHSYDSDSHDSVRRSDDLPGHHEQSESVDTGNSRYEDDSRTPGAYHDYYYPDDYHYLDPESVRYYLDSDSDSRAGSLPDSYEDDGLGLSGDYGGYVSDGDSGHDYYYDDDYDDYDGEYCDDCDDGHDYDDYDDDYESYSYYSD